MNIPKGTLLLFFAEEEEKKFVVNGYTKLEHFVLNF